MNTFTKLIAGVALVCTLGLSAKAGVLSTNLPAGVFLISTDRANVYSITITGGTNSVVSLYDCDTVADPYYGTNYVSAEWIGRSSYATNIASSVVGYNGYTNWFTNSGIFSYSVTNAAATNALTPLAVFAHGANFAETYNTDALFIRGIVARASVGCSIVINYNSH
jgi:hypothetical protein